jgi:hypothetical protein
MGFKMIKRKGIIMKGKLSIFFVIMLLIANIFFIVNSIKAETLSNYDDEYNKDELNFNIDNNEKPIRPPLTDEIILQEPTLSKGSRSVFEPPWVSHWWTQEKEIYGACDAWQEGSSINGHYGKTHIQTWAAGAGWTFIRLYLCQGFYYYVPETTTYTIQITHSAEGSISGSTWGYHSGSACNSKVYYFFAAGFDNFERVTILDEWSYFGDSGYSKNFDKTITCTLKVELEEGNAYWIGSQTLMKDWSEGFGISYAKTDSKTKGDHSHLEKITISWNNDPPTAPRIDGPSSARQGDTISYRFTSTDPDGDEIYYYIDWGDGATTDWAGPLHSGGTLVRSHTWDVSGSYIIRAKAIYYRDSIHQIMSFYNNFFEKNHTTLFNTNGGKSGCL